MFTSRRITTMGGDKFRDEFSLAFDGSDEYIDCGEKFELNAFSVSAWVKTTSDASTSQIIFGNRSESAVGYICYLNSAQKPTFKNMDVTITSSEILEINKWYHLVYTFNGTSDTYGIYINGKQNTLTSSTTATVSGVSPARIGIEAYNLNYDWNGNMSEVAVYNADLSASQVRTLYNGREPYNHKEGVANRHLEGWWRMGDGTFDQKTTGDHEGGIICDMNNVSLGSDVLGGKGDFSDASYWTLLNNSAGQTDRVEISSGVCQFKYDGSTNTNGAIRKTGILTAGKIYRIDMDITANSGTSVFLDEGNPYIRINPSEGDTGSYTVYWRASVNDLRIYRYDSTGDSYDQTATIDNVVIREVTGGNHGNMVNMHPLDFEGDTP